jgi:transcriptional regulator with XRE-family HTH domain
VRKVRPPLPPGALEALAELGAGLRDLRRRRRIPVAAAAGRALISRSTLYKVERGDPGVSLGIYATVLQGYGMLERLAGLAEARFDQWGLALETARLPRRIRPPRVPGQT